MRNGEVIVDTGVRYEEGGGGEGREAQPEVRGGLVEDGGLAFGGKLGSDRLDHRSVVRLYLFLSKRRKSSSFRHQYSGRLFRGHGLGDLCLWFRLGGWFRGM